MQSHVLWYRESVRILSMRIDRIDEQQCIERILAALRKGQGGWVVTVNVDILRRYRHDPSFRTVADRATIKVADGMPLVWASTLLASPLPERVSGSNLLDSLSGAAADQGRRVFLLGGDPGTAEATREVLRARYARLTIVGTACPPIGFEADPHQVDDLRAVLREANPDIIFVALGSPKQEMIIERLRACLPCSWWLGVGISFSFMSGRVKRAPQWAQEAGLEWLHRLSQEPRRLCRRYLIHGIPFACYLLSHALVTGVRRRLGKE